MYPFRTSGKTTTFEAFQYVAVANYFAGDLWTSIYNCDPVKTGPTLQLRRATRITTNATPEPIKKGGLLTVKGKARKDGCYRYYSKQTSTAGVNASVGDCVNVK